MYATTAAVPVPLERALTAAAESTLFGLALGFGPAFMLRAEVARASQELLPCCRSAGLFTTKPHTCWQASAQRDAKATVLMTVSSVRGGISSLGCRGVAGFGARNQIKIPGENIPFQDMETPFEKRLKSNRIKILSRIGSSDLGSLFVDPSLRKDT